MTTRTLHDNAAFLRLFAAGDTVSADDASGLVEIANRLDASVTDPAAFWRFLTPAQCRALLAAAPKVAGPWVTLVEKESRAPAYAFRAISSDRHAAFVEERGGRFEWTTVADDPDNFRPEHESTLDAAKAAADAALIEAGYLLDTPTPESPSR